MKENSKFLLAMAAAAGLCLSPSSLSAVEIAPATAQDILSALGPDARGLVLPQEALPDLFTLTANRIDEDPAKFIVQEPYTSGHWMGGKVVIEFARDLSYTVVSVYDKQGTRQRIYSVRTSFSEQVQKLNEVASAPQPHAVPSEPRPARPPEAAPPASQPEAVPPPTPVRYVPAKTVSAAKAVQSKTSYEWDDAKGAYLPVTVSETVPETEEAQKPVAAPTPPPPAKPEHPEEQVVVARAPAKKAPPSDDIEEVWVRVTPRRSKSSGTNVKVASTTWVERTEQAPKPEYRLVKRHRRHPKAKPPAEAPVVVSAPVVQKAEPAAKPPVPVVALAKTPAMQEVPLHPAPVTNVSVPSEEELLDIKPPASNEVPVAASKAQPAPSPSAVVPVPPPAVAPALPTVQAPSAVPSASAPSAPSAPVIAPKVPEPAKTTIPVAVAPPPVSAPPVPPASAPPAPAQNSVPSTEELLASSQKSPGPDTSAGDAWVPKATPKPVVTEPVEPPAPKEPVKVAMAPAPADNSVENLLKIANERQPSAPRDSDAWVPHKTRVAKPEVDIDQEVARIRARETKEAAKHKTVRVRRDVNNPEEGVLPVSSFEKFSGPVYGRHREYERRFVPGKKKRAKVPDHDFYVDEVDRKKEIHNVYFYMHQKGKAPKLVAVERHDKVSFMGNYDIEKEDKGKISTYN